MEKVRYNSFDFIKGMACIAVVLIHYNFASDAGLMVKTFCRFAVPIFFITSGFFFLYNGKMDATKTVRKICHITKILFGACIFYVIYTLAENLWLNPEWDMRAYMVEKLTADKLVKLLLTNDPTVYAHLWFLLALIYCYLFLLLCFDGIQRYTGILAGVLLVGYSCMQEFGTVLGIRRSIAIVGTGNRLYLYNLFLFRALPFFLFGIL